jgi:hypothetical protein
MDMDNIPNKYYYVLLDYQIIDFALKPADDILCNVPVRSSIINSHKQGKSLIKKSLVSNTHNLHNSNIDVPIEGYIIVTFLINDINNMLLYKKNNEIFGVIKRSSIDNKTTQIIDVTLHIDDKLHKTLSESHMSIKDNIHRAINKLSNQNILENPDSYYLKLFGGSTNEYDMDKLYEEKYLKYKQKYNDLKNI